MTYWYNQLWEWVTGSSDVHPWRLYNTKETGVRTRATYEPASSAIPDYRTVRLRAGVRVATNRRGRRIHTIIIMGRGCHTSRSPNTGRGSVVRRGATAIHGIEAAKAWDRETGLRQTPCTNDPGNIREWAGVPTHWSAASYTPQIRPPNRHQVAVDLRFLRSEVARDYAPADSLNIILKPDQNQVKAAAGRGRVGAALTRTRAGWYYVTARVDRGDFGQELYMRGMEPLRLDNKIQNHPKKKIPGARARRRTLVI